LRDLGADEAAELDANPNPLREEVFPLTVLDGVVALSAAPGLGVEPDLRRLAPYIVRIEAESGPSAGWQVPRSPPAVVIH
jgi:hypothetical protein